MSDDTSARSLVDRSEMVSRLLDSDAWNGLEQYAGVDGPDSRSIWNGRRLQIRPVCTITATEYCQRSNDCDNLSWNPDPVPRSIPLRHHM
jgi:hypothetical protein